MSEPSAIEAALRGGGCEALQRRIDKRPKPDR